MQSFIPTVLFCCLISACSTNHYQPSDYSIYDRDLKDFFVSGRVYIESINIDEDPIVIYNGLSKFQTTHQSIADALARQLKREISENSTIDGELDKRLYVQVDKLLFSSELEELQFDIHFSLVGDRGFEKHFDLVNHRTSYSKEGIERSFDKAIAECVKKALTNSQVLKYLADNEIKPR